MIREYNPWSLQPQITSIAVVSIILVTFSLIYYFRLQKQKIDETPHGFVLLVQIYISFIRNLTIEIFGLKGEKLTSFFLYLFSYICLSNLIGIIGLSNPTSSLTTTFSLGLMMWFGVFFVGLKYQKISYLKNFCCCLKIKNKKIPLAINPLEVISCISPLISISLRLWGNVFAGGLILSLWFYFTNYIFEKIPIIGVINILGGLTMAPLHVYFDLLCGIIQALVFVLLTMVYWVLAKGENSLQEMNDNKNNENRI